MIFRYAVVQPDMAKEEYKIKIIPNMTFIGPFETFELAKKEQKRLSRVRRLRGKK